MVRLALGIISLYNEQIMNKVAIISKDTKVRFFLHHCIPRGFVVEGFGNLAEFQKYHGKEIFALVMIDTDLHLNELYIYQKNLRHRCSPWIALSSTDKVSQIIKILGTSIDDVLPKPIIKEQFRKVILQQVVRAKLNPHYDDDILSGILVGRSPAIRKIRQWIYKFAATDDPILITGESGTGKEVVAECLFKCSTRRKAGFFPQNIAAIPKDLIATTLFGAISGAYTGAKETPGLFESCGEGTVALIVG